MYQWLCPSTILLFHFLLYVVLILRFDKGVMIVSKKGMEPSGLVCSTVNWSAQCIMKMCCSRFSLSYVCCMIKVSPKYLFHHLSGFSTVLQDMIKVFYIYFGYCGANWGSHGHPFICFRTFPETRTMYCEDRIPEVV